MEYTEIVVILDRSGSMQSARSDHEGGLKSFVEDQKALKGDVRFTLVQFDTNNPCEIVYDGVPIENVGKIELIPRGGTPLLDAVGKSLAHVEKRIGDAKPDQVVVMVITDGHENASTEWKRATVKARVEELEKTGCWKFLFLGAGIDAFADAGSVGFSAQSTVNTMRSGGGLKNAYAATSSKLMSNRTVISASIQEHGTFDRNVNSLDYSYTDAERALAMSEEGDEVGALLGSGGVSADTQSKGRRRRGGGGGGSAAGGNGS